MSKVAVVYWSGTGNTEMMAQEVAAGAGVTAVTPGDFSAAALSQVDAVAFGCPAMGAEELEESEFAPMFDAIEGSLSGKKVGLFGSYGWGDGEWMRSWESRVQDAGAVLVQPGVMANYEPDDDCKAACRALGSKLAE